MVLQRAGFQLVRSKKHETWEKALPTGEIPQVRLSHQMGRDITGELAERLDSGVARRHEVREVQHERPVRAPGDPGELGAPVAREAVVDADHRRSSRGLTVRRRGIGGVGGQERCQRGGPRKLLESKVDCGWFRRSWGAVPTTGGGRPPDAADRTRGPGETELRRRRHSA
jgi:hypothetical protein